MDGGSEQQDRTRTFLLRARGADCCDECLARGLRIDVADAAATARVLARQPAFLRDTWYCASCGAWRQVTRAINARAGGELPATTHKWWRDEFKAA
jgi:hypothetical protein